MPLDGGVIVGYLVAALVKGVAEQSVGSLLRRLTARVRRRMGDGPLDDLRRGSGDPVVREHVAQQIQRVAARDPIFARDLADVQWSLDQSGARYLLGDVHAYRSQMAVGNNPIAIGSIRTGYRHPGDVRHAPPWAKGLIAVGMLLCIVGVGMFGHTMLTYQPDLSDPDFGRMPDGFGRAAAVFFGGFVLAAVGSLVAALTRDRD
jgi:hypothetical protein